MGSLLSRPKMPSLPAPVIMAAPRPAPDATLSNANNPPNSGDKTALSPDELRVQDILTRRRGRLGTIGTSLRGVLSDSLAPARKTLLGE